MAQEQKHTAGLRDVKRIAAKLGAKVTQEIEGHCVVCRVEAPHRKFWCDGCVHEMVDAAYRPWNPDYDDLIGRMKVGLEDCADPECEWCNSDATGASR